MRPWQGFLAARHETRLRPATVPHGPLPEEAGPKAPATIDRTTEPAEHLLDDLRGQRHITRAAKRDSVHRWQTPQQPKTLDAPPVRPARTALLFEAECDVESPVESPAEPVTVQGDGARARLCRPDCDDHGEPKAPTPPDPPATPVIRAVFMPRESLRPELPAQSSRRPVDHGSNRPGVVERQISRRRQITRRIGTAPDGGHRGPSTLQTPGGGVGAPAHSTPRGNVPNQMMSLLGGRLQTACRRRRWRRTQEDGTPRTGCHLTARLASYQA
jgi:hypothetical protein